MRLWFEGSRSPIRRRQAANTPLQTDHEDEVER